MRELFTGTVTLVFTDIEGSTSLLHTLGPRYREALEHHRALLRPGATLGFLHDQLFAPRRSDEPDMGYPERLLALNAALHFEQSLHAALGVPRLSFSYHGGHN